MNNNFEQLRRIVSNNQERILNERDLLSRKKAQENSNLSGLIDQRIDGNIKILEDLGVIELFQKIKSENLLGENTKLGAESLEKFKELKIKGNIRSYIPHVVTPEQWGYYLDHSIFVELKWDPLFISGGADGGDYTTYKEIRVFVDNGKPVLVHSSELRWGSKPEIIDSGNLFTLTTKALLSATRHELNIDPFDFSSLYRR